MPRDSFGDSGHGSTIQVGDAAEPGATCGGDKAPRLDPGSLVYKPNCNLRGPERIVIKYDQIR